MKESSQPASPHGRRSYRPSLVGLAAASLLVPPILAMIMAIVGADDRGPPTGDRALLQILVHHAAREGVLVGPYSRFGWSHPGPLLPYSLAPGYWLGGGSSASLPVMAALLAAASLGAATVAWSRVAPSTSLRAAFIVLVALMGVTLSIGWQGTAYVEIWNPVVAMVPFAALLILCVAALAGRAWCFPVTCLLHAFVAQCHVAYALPATTALALAAGSLGANPRPERRFPLLLTSAAVIAVTWAPTLVEAARNDGGNVARLLRFFLTDGTASEPERWSAALRAPLWLPGIRGAGLDLPARLIALLVAVSVPMAHGIFRRVVRRDPLLSALFLQSHGQLGAALLVVWTLPGEPHWYLLLFLKPVFLLCCLSLAVLGLRRSSGAPSPEHGASPGILAVMLIAALAVIAQLPAAFERPHPDVRARVVAEAGRLLDCVRAPGGPPVLLALRDADAWRIGAGIALHELERGRAVVLPEVERYRFGPAFDYVPGARAATLTPSLRVSSRRTSLTNATREATEAGTRAAPAAVTFGAFGPRYGACAQEARR